jgi:hypothetical protein
MFIAGFMVIAVTGTLTMIGVITLFRRFARRAERHTGTGKGPDQVPQ